MGGTIFFVSGKGMKRDRFRGDRTDIKGARSLGSSFLEGSALENRENQLPGGFSTPSGGARELKVVPLSPKCRVENFEL